MSATALQAGDLTRAVVTPSAPRFVRRLLSRKLAIVCLAFMAVVVLIAIAAPIVLPHVASEQAGDLIAVRRGPSLAHPLGTDTLGRDVLQRLLVGTQVTVIGVLEALVVILALGVPLGLGAGYFGGRFDRAVGWFTDLAFSIPGIIVVLVVLTVFRGSMLAAMVTFGVLVSPSMIRVVRSAVIPVREELYIAAAKVSGLPQPYIIRRHVLPRIAGVVVVQASLLAALALLVQTGLAFLGLLVHEPAPSWGGMVADGAGVIVLQPWLIWPPGMAIALTVLALGLFGDIVRDTMVETWSTTRAPKRRLRTPLAAVGQVERPQLLPGQAEALLAIRNLRVSFRTQTGATVQVVDDVSFDILPGEALGVVGESGCGKTATAMSILGLLPGSGQIDAGEIRFAGTDLASLPDRELQRFRGREIGLISQEPMVSFNPVFRIGTQLAEVVRRHHNISRAAARARVLELLRQVHLPSPETVARRYPHELSGGMAQRVAIARALAGEPRLLIADEPTTALDVTIQSEILALLRELQRDRKMAILLITHDWGVVADLCDRVVVMYAGQVVERAQLETMLERPLHPYTEALLAANPHHAVEVDVLPSIPGTVPHPGQWPDGCHFNPRCRYATFDCRREPIPLERLTGDRETRCIHHSQLAAR